MKYTYIYNKENDEFIESVIDYAKTQKTELVKIEFEHLVKENFSKGQHILASGTVTHIKKVMQFSHENDLSLGIIALPAQKELKNTFALSSDFEKAITEALITSEKKIDLLYCNEIMVLQEVVVGEVPPLDSFSSTMEKESIWQRMKSFFAMLKELHSLSHTSFTVTTAKEKVLKFSAVGAVGVEYNNRTFASKLAAKHLRFNDGRLSLIVLSPSSIMQYMSYIFQSHILRQTPEKLPSSVGYVHSSKLLIETKEVLNVTIDSNICVETPIDLATKSEALALSVGEEFWKKSASERNIKENVKVEHLPRDEEMSNYLDKSIPMFSHASKEQFSALFTNLREESKLSSTFMTLLILATMIATFGLYINSASVIIGAMLLAPLMQPIVSLSMGVLRQDTTLLFSGAKTVFWGVIAVLFSAFLIAKLLPLEQLTSEMNGRLSPTILDMFVAIVSGMAAAYAKSNEKIVSSLAGVAIAVALVPPIAVAGIGLGWADWSMFSSAFLLFITNLVGIILAASLTFVVLGFSPIKVATKGVGYALALVAIVSVPLYISFSKMQHDIGIQKQLSSFCATIEGKEVSLKNIEIQRDEVRCEVVASDILSKEEKVELKRQILEEVDEEIKIFVTFWYEL